MKERDTGGERADLWKSPPIFKSSQTRLRATALVREAENAELANLVPSLRVTDRSDREASLLPRYQSGLAPAEPQIGATLGDSGIRAVPAVATNPQVAPSPDAQNVLAAIFGWIAGYVDTAGFLALFGVFTAHITGDLVVSVVEVSHDAIVTRVTMLPIFMISVAVATVLARATRREGHAAVFPLLALMTAALTVFGTTGILLQPFMTRPGSWAVGIVGATGVAAMAIQNMIMRDALNSWTPTTIMTGNLTQVTIQLVELALASRVRDPEERARIQKGAKSRLVRFGAPLLGFVVGALLGGILTRLYGFWSIALPIAVAGALTSWHWRRVPR